MVLGMLDLRLNEESMLRVIDDDKVKIQYN